MAEKLCVHSALSGLQFYLLFLYKKKSKKKKNLLLSPSSMFVTGVMRFLLLVPKWPIYWFELINQEDQEDQG